MEGMIRKYCLVNKSKHLDPKNFIVLCIYLAISLFCCCQRDNLLSHHFLPSSLKKKKTASIIITRSVVRHLHVCVTDFRLILRLLSPTFLECLLQEKSMAAFSIRQSLPTSKNPHRVRPKKSLDLLGPPKKTCLSMIYRKR